MNYIIFFKDKCQKNELEIDCQESDLKKKKKKKNTRELNQLN